MEAARIQMSTLPLFFANSLYRTRHASPYVQAAHRSGMCLDEIRMCSELKRALLASFACLFVFMSAVDC